MQLTKISCFKNHVLDFFNLHEILSFHMLSLKEDWANVFSPKVCGA